LWDGGPGLFLHGGDRYDAHEALINDRPCWSGGGRCSSGGQRLEARTAVGRSLEGGGRWRVHNEARNYMGMAR